MNTPLLQHNSVRILLLHQNQELLLMCAEDPTTGTIEGKTHPRFWFTIGGKIEEGEDILTAATRELWEETGLQSHEVHFGPVVWYGRFPMILNGNPTDMQQQFIIAHTTNRQVQLQAPTAIEKKVIKKLAWFTLEDIIQEEDIIFPIILPEILPTILEKNYPDKPIWVDLGHEP